MRITGAQWKALFGALDLYLELPECERPALLERLELEAPALKRQLDRLLSASAGDEAGGITRPHAALDATSPGDGGVIARPEPAASLDDVALPPHVVQTAVEARRQPRRHRPALVASALVAVSLAAILAGAMFWRGRLARRDAERQTAHLQIQLGAALTARQPDAAIMHFETALALLDGLHDQDSLDRATALAKLAYTRYSMHHGLVDVARRDLLAGLAIVEHGHALDPLHAVIAGELAELSSASHDLSGAERWQRDALSFWRRLGSGQHALQIGVAASALGSIMAAEQRFDAAQNILTQAIDILTQAVGADHPTTLEAKARLAEVYAELERFADSAELLRQVRDSARNAPHGSIDATQLAMSLATAEFARGRWALAEELLMTTSIDLRREPLDVRYGVSASQLAVVLAARGKFADAEQYYVEAGDVLRRYAGQQAPELMRHALHGAWITLLRGDVDLAARQVQSVLESDPNMEREVPRDFNWCSVVVAQADARAGRFDAARARLTATLERVTGAAAEAQRPDQEAQVRYAIGVTLNQAGLASEAEDDLRRAVELRVALDDPASPWLAQARIALAEALLTEAPLAYGNVTEARGLLEMADRALHSQELLAESYRVPLRMARLRLARLRMAPR